MKRRILITGVTDGLGRSLLGPLSDIGHTVVGCGRTRAKIAALKQDYPSPHRFDVVDVSKWNQVRAWAGEVIGDGGAPDLLVNNAGVINHNAPLWAVSDEEFAEVMDINVRGTANVIRAFLPAMIDNGRGVVVNMSSGWGRSTAPEVAPYCASKWAVEGLTKALSQELPRGLCAVAVNPGIIDTAMLRICWGEAAARCPSPDAWAEKAVGILLSITEEDNGRSFSIMGR